MDDSDCSYLHSRVQLELAVDRLILPEQIYRLDLFAGVLSISDGFDDFAYSNLPS